MPGKLKNVLGLSYYYTMQHFLYATLSFALLLANDFVREPTYMDILNSILEAWYPEWTK